MKESISYRGSWIKQSRNTDSTICEPYFEPRCLRGYNFGKRLSLTWWELQLPRSSRIRSAVIHGTFFLGCMRNIDNFQGRGWFLREFWKYFHFHMMFFCSTIIGLNVDEHFELYLATQEVTVLLVGVCRHLYNWS